MYLKFRSQGNQHFQVLQNQHQHGPHPHHLQQQQHQMLSLNRQLGAIRVTQHPPIVLPGTQIIETETKSDEEVSEPVSFHFIK